MQKIFSPPDQQTRQRAIGQIDQLPPSTRMLLTASGFDPMKAPDPSDWLAVHPESGQSYFQFINSRPNLPGPAHRTIYLQPLEAFPADAPSLSQLKTFTESYFSMPVTVLPLIPGGLGKITTRVNPDTRKMQLLTGDILSALKNRLPDNAYCLLGITLSDLYPGPAWNYVFGEATLDERVGIYSFARYDPRFSGENVPDRTRLLLRRCCKILAHETGHMFGIEHCIYFQCVMNGSNHLPEDDSKPLHLCPVDLHKLYFSTRLDVVARYAHLRDFCRQVGFSDEAGWIEQQLKKIPPGR